MKLALIFLSFALVACNGGGGGGGNSGSTALAPHQGIWSACESYDGDENGTDDSSIQSILAIAEDSISLIRTNFTGTNCVSGSEEYRFTSTTSYTRLGNSYTTILKSDTYVPLKASEVASDNSFAWCGLTNWVLNVPQNTLGLNCGGVTSSYGDVQSVTILRSGNSLTIDDLTYDLAIGTDFTPAGLSLPNGSFAYSDGVSFAAFAIFSSGTYNVYRYDLASKAYFIETGTYTSSNNVVNFTVTSSNPAGCVSGSASRRFTTGSLGLTMEFVEDDLILFAQKVSYAESNFRTAYLGGGFSLGCF
jgi:hypothetical protein